MMYWNKWPAVNRLSVRWLFTAHWVLLSKNKHFFKNMNANVGPWQNYVQTTKCSYLQQEAHIPFSVATGTPGWPLGSMTVFFFLMHWKSKWAFTLSNWSVYSKIEYNLQMFVRLSDWWFTSRHFNMSNYSRCVHFEGPRFSFINYEALFEGRRWRS